MQGQIALIGGSRVDLDSALDRVETDPSFGDFVEMCEARGIPLTIASDGVDYFVSRLLRKIGLERVPSVANQLAGEQGAWTLVSPARPISCASGTGVCKCAIAAGPADDALVVIGDGRSDFCVGLKADSLFAKGALAEYADRLSKPYLSFSTFDDVTRTLSDLAGRHPDLRHDTTSV